MSSASLVKGEICFSWASTNRLRRANSWLFWRTARLVLFSPGVQHSPEKLTAETYDLSGGSVSLVLFWMVIGFLIVYLRRLLAENTRIRKLYRGDGGSTR